MKRRRLFLLLYGVVLLVVLGVWPRAAGGTGNLAVCVLCGPRALADAILGALLFVPLGIGLSRTRWFAILAAALVTSVAIQLVRMAVPGGQPRAAELLFHVSGAAVGLGLGRTSRFWVDPSRYAGDRLGTVAAIVAALSMLLTAWLYHVDLPEPPYRVEWETARPHLADYGGAVLTAGIQPLALSPGPSGQGERIHTLLERGTPMAVLVRVGPPPEGLAQLLALYDRRDRAVAFLGVDSTDLVYREHTRASRWGLDNPDTRARGALDSLAAGDIVRLATLRRRGERCFLVAERLSCGYGVAGAHAWRFLYAANSAPHSVLSFLDASWLALLFFPVGYWARWHLAIGLGTAVAAYGWMGAPAETLLLPVPPVELTGIAAGVVLGLLVRGLRRRRSS